MWPLRLVVLGADVNDVEVFHGPSVHDSIRQDRWLKVILSSK